MANRQYDPNNPVEKMSDFLKQMKNGSNFDIQKYISVMEDFRNFINTDVDTNKNFTILYDFFERETKPKMDEYNNPINDTSQKILLKDLLKIQQFNADLLRKMNSLETARQQIVEVLNFKQKDAQTRIDITLLETGELNNLFNNLNSLSKSLNSQAFFCPDKACKGKTTGPFSLKKTSTWFFSRKKSSRRNRNSKRKPSRRKSRKSKGKSKGKSKRKSKRKSNRKSKGKSKRKSNRKSKGNSKFPLRSRR
jgi:hypothetical protein